MQNIIFIRIFRNFLVMLIVMSFCRPSHCGSFQAAARKSSSYTVKIAQSEDICFIRNCNLANLPENYDSNFYHHQIRTWPELSLVCQDKDENIVGYALGRVLESNDAASFDIPVYKGHVASIAVSKAHRGHKLAHQMMDLMHMQFALHHNIDEIDLFCRVSNSPAIKLYQSFNYECNVLMHKYYNDGEDAYRMILPNFRQKYRDVTESSVTSRLAPQKTAKQIPSYSLFNPYLSSANGIGLWDDAFKWKS